MLQEQNSEIAKGNKHSVYTAHEGDHSQNRWGEHPDSAFRDAAFHHQIVIWWFGRQSDWALGENDKKRTGEILTSTTVRLHVSPCQLVSLVRHHIFLGQVFQTC